MITLKELCKKYKKSVTYFRTILCRPEFNQFRVGKKYLFNDDPNLHSMIKFTIKKSELKYKRSIILLFFMLNIQAAYCQRYEPVIIYNQNGKPQTMLKGYIKYDNYGVPKFNLQTKRSMHSLRKKQGH